MSEPLKELHQKQLRARFPNAVGPPCFLEMMWSISKGVSSQLCGSRQYSQQCPARCQTCCARAASICKSGSGAFLGFDAQGTPRARFENREQGTRFGIGE